MQYIKTSPCIANNMAANVQVTQGGLALANHDNDSFLMQCTSLGIRRASFFFLFPFQCLRNCVLAYTSVYGSEKQNQKLHKAGIILGRDIERFSHIFPENLIEIFK